MKTQKAEILSWSDRNPKESLADRLLLLAIIEQALSDVRSGNQNRCCFGSTAAQCAARWINDLSEENIFTFCGACQVLGLDPASLRAWVFGFGTSASPKLQGPSGVSPKLILGIRRSASLETRAKR